MDASSFAAPAGSEPADMAMAAARAAGLRYVMEGAPGFSRAGAPGAFTYCDAQGKPLRDAQHLQRIAALAIPPAYAQVWICADARGHLQATGRDARGRKQYRYQVVS